ncbi:MAG TPA: hypothetical protein PKM44_05670 [Turneriella sp.]|nr:hypothetical protein [Turneriella sp.]HNA78953.1 hypothetical protein [Turneriella sp.]HNE20269.1 hypothetical protein [Turneriella sp.]HNJ65571.1 hypothetical protein [Turneriella sp.]HNL09978.1 hypothetical protein [Turneriella sp.]
MTFEATGALWAIFATIVTGFGIASLMVHLEYVRSRKMNDWREEFRIQQMESNRRLQRIHDENTRFFRSMGLTTQQIFERVDRGLDWDRTE